MTDFLPVTREEMEQRGWTQPDFIYVSGDAYVDHPSFGPAIITRMLEAYGYKVCMIPQPDWTRDDCVFPENQTTLSQDAGDSRRD